MPNDIVTAEGAPQPPGPFAPAVLATGSRVLSISGQIADNAFGQIVGGDDAGEQARQALGVQRIGGEQRNAGLNIFRRLAMPIRAHGVFFRCPARPCIAPV
jgi:hypothetical protein